MRFLSLILALACFAATASAQNTWYVDPVNGSNSNDGTTSVNSFLSIRHALQNASLAAGDTILLAGGIYDSVNGTSSSGNKDEVFPLTLVSGVSIRAGNAFDLPVIDGSTTGSVASVLFEVEDDIVTTTYLDGLELTNCGTAIATDNIGQSPAVNGLVIESCSISGYDDNGIAFQLVGGNADFVVIRDCFITGGIGSDFGVFIHTEGTNQVLIGGGIEDCSITGNVQGIYVSAGANGLVGTGFKILRNAVTGFSGVGIRTSANTWESQYSGVVRGNTITGDGVSGTGDVCLQIDATLNSSGFLVTNNGLVSYNDFSQADVNIYCQAMPISSAGAVVSNQFVGNVIRNATNYGVQLSLNTGLGSGMAPDFGTGSGLAGRNSFDNGQALAEVRLASGMSNSITMVDNFWPDAGANAQARIDLNGSPSPTINSILAETLVGVLDSAVIKPDLARTLIITLSEGRFVVQVDELGIADINADIGTHGQYKVFALSGTGGLIDIPPTDLTGVQTDGSIISFNIPALDAGNYTINFTNPGFQSLTPIGLRVTSGSSSGGGGGGGGGCVVATAAHGDYNAPEVRILRQFRDQYLIPRDNGRSVVRGYYQHGEPVAAYIAENEWARKATRTALVPATAVAWSLLNWNTGQRFLMAVVLLGFFFKLGFGGRRP